MYRYIENIVVKKKLDFLDRMPDKILVKIISRLALEDISKLAQVNNHFRQVSYLIKFRSFKLNERNYNAFFKCLKILILNFLPIN